MTLFKREEFKRKRWGDSEQGDDGRYKRIEESVDSFDDGSFRKPSDRDVETAPEGKRKNIEYTLNTKADLRPDNQYSNKHADHVLRVKTGVWFEVVSNPGESFFLPGQKYTLARLQEQ